MKNITDCKDEKITEKAFSHHLLVSILSILLCIVALCSITYAWFTSETQSGNNTLTAGSFHVTISVLKHDAGGNVTADEVTLTKVSGKEGSWQCDLAPGTYTISLKLTDDATVKGHCKVQLGAGTVYHTDAIIGEKTNNVDTTTPKTDPFTFTLTVTEASTLTLEPVWGVVVAPDIQYTKDYSASGNAISAISGASDSTEPSDTPDGTEPNP